MSWDVLLTSAPAEAKSVDDIPKGEGTGSIAPLPRLLATLREAFPEADLSDPAWGHLRDEEQGWSMELNIGAEDPVRTVMLHVRGGDAVPAILRMAQVLGCRALDCSTGDFLREDGGDGWESFREYRDQVLLRAAPEETGPSAAP
ncbi:hypothetical protein MRI28_00705 [Nocardiopsis dassonvillei]|uniref:hypothetical protein n=1 Tax=Nocardiopsis dassonvillei TaxID=2014 RepID=UPI00200E4CEF|nr:hypothetical protein [Nocardiopsis dassonvillei]MCK9868189.1 hypothetical protein [Nocardiopsis dassonvillei]